MLNLCLLCKGSIKVVGVTTLCNENTTPAKKGIKHQIVKAMKRKDEAQEDYLKLTLVNYNFYLKVFVEDRKRTGELVKGFLKQLYHKLVVHKQRIRIKQQL